jgi:hypothetical protein
MKRLLTFLCIVSWITVHPTDGIYILIHGTWGNKSEWYTPHGSFYKILEKAVQQINYKVISYTWSGSFDHNCRLLAGNILAKLIQSYPANTIINIVSHSHGGNVAAIASQVLAADSHNKQKINALFSFGIPVDTHYYMPNMNIIKKMYNFFSYKDKVQPIFGLYSREYPNLPRIANIRICIENKEPSHGQLTSDVVAHWIPLLHEDLAEKKIGNFQYFEFTKPGAINFSSYDQIYYAIDINRKLEYLA